MWYQAVASGVKFLPTILRAEGSYTCNFLSMVFAGDSFL